MQKPLGRAATYEDLCAVPEHLVAEIVGGELVTSPRPGPRHARVASKLGAKLDPFDAGEPGGPGGWVILDEPELHLGADVVVPDLAGWRAERMPELPEEAFFTLAPDWVCEVLSPATARRDRTDKLALYAREAVAFAWLIDPAPQTLEVYEHGRDLAPAGRAASRWSLVATFAGDARVRAVPFDAIALDLTALWAPARG